ncbi:MAG: methyl-accepting chemotaxis protein [Treponema sp.]|jgi:methyl-accepting chemotaxis protein|nr:methyl-accepting chemotaxis protein [Treponema sp.]
MKHSIKTSLMLSLSLGMLLISVTMTFLIGRTVYNMNTSQIQKSIVTLTEKKSNEVESQLSNIVNTAENLSGVLGGIWAIPPERRRRAVEMEVRALVKTTSIDSAWAYWVPDMFDGRDEQRVDSDANPTGQFKVHYIKDKSGKIKNETVSELSEAEIEGKANTAEASVSDPKEILLDGEKVLSIKAFSRILNSLQQNVGVAGVDLVLTDLDETIDGRDIYSGTVCEFLTSSGKVISSSDGTAANTTSPFFSDPESRGKFTAGDGTTETTSFYHGSGNGRNFVTVSRMIADKTGAVWYLVSSTPVSEINRSAASTVGTIILAFVMQILVVLAIVWISVSRMMNPLRQSATALKNISEGDGDLTVRLKVVRSNEIGDMSDSFNKTMEKIGDSIKDVKASSREMSLVGEELNASMEETAEAIETITASIRSVQNQMQEYSAGVEETKSTVVQIVRNIQMLNTNIDSQASSVEESSRSVEEMNGNIESVAEILKKSRASMEELESAGELGKSLINNTSQLSTEIADKSAHLSEASSVIKNIAKQTNLLAMNAAIEAAHAGKEGQGFAVVAEEIRKLAEESSAQSSKIQSALKEVSDIIQAVSRSTLSVQQQFNTIFGLTKTVSGLEKDIDRAMTMQTQSSAQILEAMRKIKSITQSVKEGSDEMMEGSRQVSIEMDAIARMTGNVNANMQDMSSKASLITDSATKVNGCVGRNSESIQKLKNATDKFKV